MAESVAIDMREVTITPVFRWETLEDVNASEREKHLVKKMIQVVEVRFAGPRNYQPVFPVDAVWKRENGNAITYAERWSEQYRAFLEGNAQEALGTPLEMLRNYGISDALLSLCRALKIYSIEALHHLEGDGLKSLGIPGNSLKQMARAYMADRERGGDAASEMEALRAEVAALRLAQAGATHQTTEVLVPVATEEEVEAALTAATTEIEQMDDAQLKAFIKGKTGQAPRGTPSHEFLVNAAMELATAPAA